MTVGARLRLPPAGDAWGPGDLRRILNCTTTTERLSSRLALRLGADRVSLFSSGREAMRRGVMAAARATGRGEVLVPGYCCFSVPASVVAAGLRVRLVDVDAEGRIDVESLERVTGDDVAAIVVCNLFGRAEPIESIQRWAAEVGAWVIDDAAQAFGATAPGATGRGVGARSELGVLSFGRGKPLSGLGGGALVFGPGVEPEASVPEPVAPTPRRAVMKAIAWNLALHPIVFSALAAIPQLGIGDTPFEPDFDGGPINGASLVLTDVALDGVAAAAERRLRIAQRLALDLRSRTRFEPITAGAGEQGVYPRLAVRAPDAGARTSALASLDALGAGASPYYPSALSGLAGLRPHLSESSPMPGAEELASRVFTLPVHGRLTDQIWESALAAL